MKKIIYTTLIREDAKHIVDLLDDSGIKSESSSSLLNDHIYINSASANEYIIYVDEIYLHDARSILERNDITPYEAVSEQNKREVDYLHDSQRLAIFGMLIVPVILNLLSIYKFAMAVTHKEQMKFGRVISIVIFNTIGLTFWSIVLYNKYLSQ